MGYRSALLTRWTRRDRLAIVVVAITIAFLTGTTLLILSAGEQTTTIAANFVSPGHVTHYESLAAAESALPPGGAVVPYALVTESTGTSNYVANPPENATLNLTSTNIRFEPRRAVTQGSLSSAKTVELRGAATTHTIQVTPGSTPLLPDEWFVAPAETADALGIDGAFVIAPSTGQATPASRETPLLSALAFFLLGTRQALGTLSITALGAGLLVGITIFSVTRMTVQDRLRTIQLIRATGGTPRQILGLYSLRAVLITLVGSALGYAIGVILPSATINLAVFTGLPTSLSVSVTSDALRILAPLILGVTLVGGLSGGIAAWPAATRPPGQITGRVEHSTPAGDETAAAVRSVPVTLIRPQLLDIRSIIPTAAIVTAFVLFAVLIFSIGGVMTPLTASEGATVTEPETPHPFASQVPENYAVALRSQGIDASPEVLLLEVVEGKPFLARGVNYTAYETLTHTEIARGRPPASSSEAVIGSDLAQTIDVDVGDAVTLGGSTELALSRVSIVGVYDASGPVDDQLLVSLATARHLAGLPPDRVHFIRSSGLPTAATNRSGVGVIDVAVPRQARSNTTVSVGLTLRNDGLTREDTTVAVTLGDERQRLSVSLPPQTQRTETLDMRVGGPGTYVLSAGNITEVVRVTDAQTFAIQPFPSSAPPHSDPLLRVVNTSGSPVSGVSVEVANQTLTSNARGEVRIPVRDAGTYEIRLTKGSQTRSLTLDASPDADRALLASVSIQPSSPSVLTQPTANLQVFNPWNRSITTQLTLHAPRNSIPRNISVGPGATQTVRYQLDHAPPGTYPVSVTAEDDVVAETTYTVSGDERIATTLARSGRVQETGLSRAIETAFGNFNLLLGIILLLAALMTIGGTTASFAKEVHARRQTIGIFRATGASPLRMYRIVLTDALKIGTVATALATVIGLGILTVLGSVGLLTVFGIRLSPVPTPTLLVGIIVGGVLLSLLGAGLAITTLLWIEPSRLLAGEPREMEDEGGGVDE